MSVFSPPTESQKQAAVLLDVAARAVALASIYGPDALLYAAAELERCIHSESAEGGAALSALANFYRTVAAE